MSNLPPLPPDWKDTTAAHVERLIKAAGLDAVEPDYEAALASWEASRDTLLSDAEAIHFAVDAAVGGRLLVDPPKEETAMTYDSRPDTAAHADRVLALLRDPLHELRKRALSHDMSKMEPPEVAVFDEFTPKLRTSTYGSDEYKGFLEAMGEGLAHHYANNRHHPEHFEDGIDGMTLVDLLEMLADWKAATERHADGSLERSFEIQRDRFGISPQLESILRNTALHFGWVDPPKEEE